MKHSKLTELLAFVYGEEGAYGVIQGLKELANKYGFRFNLDTLKIPTQYSTPNKKALIVYADSVVSGSSPTLKVLKEFLDRYSLNRSFDIVHILPFYPWDTDRGFSVIDYYKVNPEYGDWEDIQVLARDFDLMFDFVLNHASIQNPWVQGALIERHLSPDHPEYHKYAKYKDFVIAFDKNRTPDEYQLKKLARPRPYPVLTPYVVYQSSEGHRAVLGSRVPKDAQVIGEGYVWTTFSRQSLEDGTTETRQVDLNYANPNVFLKALDVLLFYVTKGAKLVRLDAVGYMYKKLGTTSLHLPETHALLKAMRIFLYNVVPEVTFIAEVNEEQQKVFEYLGDDMVESDLVYQFTHFPLAIYSILFDKPDVYNTWLKSIQRAQGRQFVTVLGSHDGMGLKPLRGILPPEEIQHFAEYLVDKHGGLPNFAYLPGGKKIIYEVCSTPFELINGKPAKDGASLKAQLNRYFKVIGLALQNIQGIHAFYINGLLGSFNYYPPQGLDENRTVNRQRFKLDDIITTLKHSPHKEVFEYVRWVKLQ